jgi:plastocyanin
MRKAIAISAVASLAVTAASATSFAGSGSEGPAAQASQAAAKVSMKDNFYKPAKVIVPVGSKVKWVNRGQLQHSATQIGGGFDTGLLAPGGVRGVKFKRAGTYKYVCSIHPNMKGKVAVTKAG